MALNKFIPLSPDPNITRDSDMGMAQFGHLNTIIDYLNSALNISKYNIIITKLNQIFILFELYLIICLLFFSLQKSSFE